KLLGYTAALHQVTEYGGFGLRGSQQEFRHGAGGKRAVCDQKDVDGSKRDGAGGRAGLGEKCLVTCAERIDICAAGNCSCDLDISPTFGDYHHVVEICGRI